MKQIKVKAYGVIDISKRQYLIIQTVGFAILAMLFIYAQLNDFSTSENIFLKYLETGAGIIILLEIIETGFMLKKFREKERLFSMQKNSPE